MTAFKVKLKWNKQVFDDVVVDPSGGAMALKKQLSELTGVTTERQKVMAKGLWKGTLKDDQDISGLPWKDGVLIAMMGTATAGIAKEPEEKVVFVEDMTAQEKQQVAALDPPGLVNLGNTCYMNSTLQCLKAIPELRESLQESPLSANSADVSEKMTYSLRELFREMDQSDSHVTPFAFVQTMRLTFPQFAQQGPKGGFAQQDADEFLNELLNVMSQKLTKPGKGLSFGNKDDAISALFGVELSTTMKCIESDDEPVTKGAELLRRLQCNITSDVATLEQGLKLGFEAEIEKQSSVLSRNALFKQTKRIHRLPFYLAIQFNRFFWKRTPDSRDHQGVNCKILKPVKFSFTLDVFDFCDDELRSILQPARDAWAKERMARNDEGATKDGEGDSAKAAAAEADTEMGDADDEELQKALKMSMSDSGDTAGIGIPPNFRGIYELFGVVTHKGRASDSGHYIGWVKQEGDNWVCFDDETASHCKEEDVGQLSGGGDYDMAYIVFYRVKMDELAKV